MAKGDAMSQRQTLDLNPGPMTSNPELLRNGCLARGFPFALLSQTVSAALAVGGMLGVGEGDAGSRGVTLGAGEADAGSRGGGRWEQGGDSGSRGRGMLGAGEADAGSRGAGNAWSRGPEGSGPTLPPSQSFSSVALLAFEADYSLSWGTSRVEPSDHFSAGHRALRGPLKVIELERGRRESSLTWS